MKKLLLALGMIVLVSVSSFSATKNKKVKAPEIVKPVGNILSEMTEDNFKVEKDAPTSIEMKFSENKEIIAKYEFVPESVWAQLVINVQKPLTGLEAVKITYKTDYILDLKLFQKNLGWDGNKFYQYYQYTLEPSAEYTTVVLPLSQFNFPAWVLDKIAKGDKITTESALPLDLEQVNALHISPRAVQKDIKGEFSVKEIELIGVK